MDQSNKQGQRGFFNRFLTIVERLGNGLPHPVTMFALFALATVLLSGLGGWFDWQVADPRPVGAPGRAEDGMIRITSLMSGDGFRRIIENLVKNFVEFAPLGTVLVALLGVGIAEHSGLFSAAIRAVILGAPKTLVTAVLVFAGIMSNAASEVGYVVLVPLGAAIFYSLGRHPLAGLAAAFAGVSGGYSANLLIGTVDPLLAGITQEAARIFDPRYEVHPAVNWYFMAASVPVVTLLGTWVTAKIVEPRLGKFDLQKASSELDSSIVMQPLEAQERKGLFWASLSAALLCLGLVYLAGPIFGTTTELYKDPLQKAKGPNWQQVCGWTQGELDQQLKLTEQEREKNLAAGERLLAEAKAAGKDLKTIKLPAFPTTAYAIPAKSGWQGAWNSRLLGLPGYGVLRDPATGDLLRSPLLKGVVAIIFVFFLIPGYVYGYMVGKLRSDKDLINAMSKTMSTMGLYIVLTFFAAQFVKFFEWSNLGTMLAVVGAEGIRAIGLDNPLVFIPFIVLCATINLLMGSASAKWAVTAPIFVPMLMLVGYSPELIQNAYRIGDSVTNVITPMMSYFGMIYAFAAKYQKDLGMGTLISLMLPYSLVFLIGWTAFFYLWVFLLDFPIGPGAPLIYPPGP